MPCTRAAGKQQKPISTFSCSRRAINRPISQRWCAGMRRFCLSIGLLTRLDARAAKTSPAESSRRRMWRPEGTDASRALRTCSPRGWFPRCSCTEGAAESIGRQLNPRFRVTGLFLALPKGRPCQRPIREDHMRVSPVLVAILLIGMTIAAIAPFDVAFAAANVRVAGCARGPNSRARFDWRLLCRPCWIAPRRSRNALAGAGRVGSGHCCGCLRRGHRWTAFQKHLAGCLRRSF
jgi:hypothetical protein